MEINESIFSKLEEYAANFNVPIIHPEGAEVLTNIVLSTKPHSILEIGTAIGYSALKIAQYAPDKARIVTVELDKERITAAKHFISEANAEAVIQLVEGDAGEVVSNLPGPFDLVFIDAAKGQYLDYFKKIENKLNNNAVIIADNVLFRGLVESIEEPPRRYRTIIRRLREYLEYARSHPNFETVLHRIGDGIAVSYYRGSESE
ncbi:O-methyltransferase [Dendrosporobacter sp. 1207_IL3150]|uniref:O-methyltransferase n=1 Tax=Dendrosporobacter sp. 1207_IL3150 TaxID=3084054 RepID=UPI002FDB5333